MSRERPLQGGCSCGRNRYTIEIPQDATDVAQVFFDNSYTNRRSQATPLSAWLKVPLAWFHSSTHAFFDDETHATIRRTFTPLLDPSSKRQFCGFCGTPLSFWSESPPSEADFISLTLGSLTTTDLHDLEDLGLLPKEALEEAKSEKEMIEKNAPQEGQLVTLEGVPWFEKLVEGSRLGRMRRSSGHRRSRDGKVTVEWEIVEWTDDGGEKGNQSPVKRKLADMDHDSAMEQ